MAGVELLPNFLYTPPSLARVPLTSAPPRDLRDYARFVDVMIQLFGEHFAQVELWNEPNNWAEWDRKLDPKWCLFAEMLVQAAEVARANGKQVVLGGLSPIDPGFLVRMNEEGALDAVDVVGVHGFPGTWEASWRGWNSELARVRQITSKPIWITETGCARSGCADRQVRALRSVLGAQAERVYWYSVFDLEPTRRSLKEINLGVHDPREHRMGMGDPLRRELVAAAGAPCSKAGLVEALTSRS